MSTTMTGLDSLAAAAYRFHEGETERLKARVNALCLIVGERPDCDDIFCRMPIVSSEITGHITLEGYQTLERFFSEALEDGLIDTQSGPVAPGVPIE